MLFLFILFLYFTNFENDPDYLIFLKNYFDKFFKLIFLFHHSTLN